MATSIRAQFRASFENWFTDSENRYSLNTISHQVLKDEISNWFALFSRNTRLANLWKQISTNSMFLDHTRLLSSKDIIRGVESPQFCNISSIFIVDPEFSTSRDIWLFNNIDSSNLTKFTKWEEEDL